MEDIKVSSSADHLNNEHQDGFVVPEYVEQKILPLYHLANYTFGTKDAQPEEDTTVAARLQRLQEEYEKEGNRSFILIPHI